MADTYRLLKRGSTWYYIRRVPEHLVPLIGKRIIKASLNTRDKGEAKRLRTVKDLQTDARFAELEQLKAANSQGTEPNGGKVPLSVLIEYVRAAVQEDDDRSAKAFVLDPPEGAEVLEDMRVDAETALQILGNPEDTRRDQTVSSFSKDILNKVGADPAKVGELTEFSDIVRRALVELFRRKLDRYDDRHDRLFYDELFNPTRANPTTFGELSNFYLEEKREIYELNGVSEKRKDKITLHVQTLVEIVGSTTLVGQIDDEIVQHVRSTLARLPLNRAKIYPKFGLDAAIARAKHEKRAVLSAATQGFYLEVFRDLLRLGVRKKLLAQNPAVDAQPLKRPSLPSEQRRLPFTDDQLRSFFTGAFYQSCAPAAVNPYRKPDSPWRFWIPLVMLLSGARPNEIAQLRVCDVRITGAGTPFLDLAGDENGDELKVKTVTSRRRIPIHSELIKLGFLSFVEERRKVDGDHARLFHNLRPDKYGNYAWYPSKRFNEKFLPDEIAVAKRQSLYSLRHNVRDALRRISAPPEALRAIAGWATGGKQASDDYGDPNNPDLYVSWIEGIAYKGLDLSFLHI